MLCLYRLRCEIDVFMQNNCAEVPEFTEPVCDFEFLVDITEHFNLLNTNSRGKSN